MGSHESQPTLTRVRADEVQIPGVIVRLLTPSGTTMDRRLGIEPLVVGTDVTSDLVLEDPGVSRRHCELFFGPRGVVVRDLGSKNGTYVGNVCLQEGVLPVGTPLTLGGTQLVLVYAQEVTTIKLSRAAKFGEAVGASVAMRALFTTLELAAGVDETLLLFGESGTGKELLARGVHDRSPRRDGPFVVFDCTAVAPNLIESELFGHVKGAFTGATRDHTGAFEQAHRGTLFLDELGELPLELQPKLLRALEARTVKPLGSTRWRSVDARVIAATHRDLRAQVAEHRFRQDLYYRIAVLRVDIPPLRQRKDDIPILVDRFLAELRPPRTNGDLPPNALSLLEGHSWPGNVRELRNTVVRLATFPSLAGTVLDPIAPRDGGVGSLVLLPWREARATAAEQFERTYIQAKLREYAGNVSKTAEAMGVSRQLLHRLMQRYGIGRSAPDRG